MWQGKDFPVVSVRGTAVGNVKDTNATALFRIKHYKYKYKLVKIHKIQ